MLIRAAVGAMRESAVPGAFYLHAGVMLHGLEPEQPNVGDLLGEVRNKFGSTAIGIGVGGLSDAPSWSMKRELSSPRYTMEGKELPVLRA